MALMDYDVEIGRKTVSCVITYQFEPGYRGSSIEPPEQPSATILKIEVSHKGQRTNAPEWLFDILANDEDIHEACLQDHGDEAENAAEYQRDLRRDAA